MADTATAEMAWVAMLAALPNIHTTDIAKIPTKKGGEFSYKYASLPSILEQVKPVLAAHGWAMTQDVATSDSGHAQVSTLFDHTSGVSRRYGPLAVPTGDSGARGVGSAITYARRYALVAALGLAPDEDDDGAAATRQPQQQAQKPKPKAKAAPDEKRRHTNAAWTAVRDLFPDDTETVWWQIRETLRIARDHDLSAKEADDVVAAAAQIAEGTE